MKLLTPNLSSSVYAPLRISLSCRSYIASVEMSVNGALGEMSMSLRGFYPIIYLDRLMKITVKDS
jgi:hypothetical protein